MSNNYIRITQDPPQCPYNDGVNCDPRGRQCRSCGWHPTVAENRLEKICQELGIQLPEDPQ